ncbi:MAG: shikimate kinase [Anaerolineales bacterium]
MRVFVTGVACVGKTTIGRRAADLMGLTFFDLDHEVETFFNTSIERLQARFLTTHSFRNEAAKALLHLLARPESRHSLIALPPSGLMGGYLRAVKRAAGLVVALWDEPENILERITFYDIDTRPIERPLTAGEKRLYLKEIKKDITYFGKTYARAHLRIDIAGLDVEGAARTVKESVEAYAAKVATGSEGGKSEQGLPMDTASRRS